jgi:thiol-disulfide isomerase/thioredoxin
MFELFEGSVVDLHQKILDFDDLVMIKFMGGRCPGCKRLTTLLKPVIIGNPQMMFLEIDTNLNESIASEFDIEVMPTIKLLKRSGKNVLELASFTGLRIDDIKQGVEKFK